MLLTMPTMRLNGRRRAEKGWSSAHDTPSAVGTYEEFAISSTLGEACQAKLRAMPGSRELSR